MRAADTSRSERTPYSLVVQFDCYDEPNRLYSAYHPELLGCRGQGRTPEEAIASLDEAREHYLDALARAGVSPPPPIVIRMRADASPLLLPDQERVGEQVSPVSEGGLLHLVSGG